MRKLEVVSGLAVLLATAAYIHLSHHFVFRALHTHGLTVALLACFVVGLAVGILSLCGAFFLLRGRLPPAGGGSPGSAA
jgi:hypothetical protein